MQTRTAIGYRKIAKERVTEKIYAKHSLAYWYLYGVYGLASAPA